MDMSLSDNTAEQRQELMPVAQSQSSFMMRTEFPDLSGLELRGDTFDPNTSTQLKHM